MRKILSNPYGRDLIRIILLFLSLFIFKKLYKPFDNKSLDFLIQILLVGCVVFLIKLIINKPNIEN